MEQPLLSEEEVGQKGEEKWRLYQYLGRSASVHVPPSLSGHGEEVSVDEIRSASIHSNPYYPPSLHGALVSSPDPDAPYGDDQAIAHQGGYGQYPSENMSREYGRQILDEVEIRQLLIDHIGHHFCWGSRPARAWKIAAIEDCNVYVGTLETFIEEREVVKEIEPYLKGEVDGKDKGPELGVWELDLRSEFPLLFVAHKETKTKVPHSETIQKCTECEGQREIACHTCNADQEPGVYKENQMSRCPACYGRGLIAHQDGSDTLCTKCNGEGTLSCAKCGARGLVKCETCMGQGSLLTRTIAHVKWRTLSNRKVCTTAAAASVPDEVFHQARGVQLYNTQAYQCNPAFFADSYFLNRFSSEVIADRSPVAPSARIICERHIITVVPVTRVTMVHKKQSFSFYIIGISNEVYIKDYPSKFCWGLCCCLEWLKI